MSAFGFQHILRNLELYGFGSEDAGIVQTVKELAENAFDACKGQLKETHIRVSMTDAHSGFVRIEVMDNGCGIADCENILQCFVSSKQAGTNAVATGKFGIGLTACLLYSHITTGQNLRLTTTVPEWEMAQWSDIGFDAESSTLVVHRRAAAPKPMKSGTIVHSIVPASEPGLQHALTVLRNYFESYICNPLRTTAVEFRVNALGCVQQLHFPVAAQLHLPELQLTNDWQVTLHSELLKSFSAKARRQLDGSQVGLSAISKLGWSCFAAVVVVPRDRATEHFGHAPGMRLHRFQAPDEPQYHQTFQIQGMQDSEEEFETRFGWVEEIVVLVDICEGPVPYTTATKTVVGKSYKGLAQLVKAAIVEAAKATFDNFPQTFMSAKAAKALKMRSSDIPAIATALSEIVSRSTNIAFQEACMELLELPPNFVNPTLLAPVLKDRILLTLDTNSDPTSP